MTTSYLKMHFVLFIRLFMLAIKDLMAYSVSGYISLLGNLLVLIFYLIFWSSISTYANIINGWTFPELAVFACLSMVFWGLFSTFFSGVYNLPYEIPEGTLDLYLVRPVNPILAFIWAGIDPRGLMQSIAGILVLAFCLLNYGVHVSLLMVPLCIFFLAIGIITYTLIFVASGLLSLWIERFDAPLNILSRFGSVESYPIDILPYMARTFFTLVVPLIFTVTIPTGVLVERYLPFELLSYLLLGLAALMLWLLISWAVWSFGLKRYESAGG